MSSATLLIHSLIQGSSAYGSRGHAVSLLRAETARWPVGAKRNPTVEGFFS
jgi:hypothetical protein